MQIVELLKFEEIENNNHKTSFDNIKIRQIQIRMFFNEVLPHNKYALHTKYTHNYLSTNSVLQLINTRQIQKKKRFVVERFFFRQSNTFNQKCLVE